MADIKVGSTVKMISDDRLWKVKFIINKKCTLKQVNGKCYKTAKVNLLILADLKIN